MEVALQVHLLAGHADQPCISQPTVQEICKFVEVDVDRGIVDSEEVVHQVVVGLEFVLQVFLLFGMNLARRFMSLMRANCCLTSQKINKMNKLSKKLWKTYEALSIIQLRQGNAKKHVIRSLETLAGRLDDKARARIVDSRGSVLVLKKKALLQELDKRKRKHNAAAASQTQEVKGKVRCHQSNRLLRREREHETRARSREQRLVA